MQYVVLISPDDSSEIKEYTNYQTINDLVEGWYERCGAFGIGNKMTFLFCNEGFLFHEELQFNAVASALANQPIYGNVVLLQDGYNEDNEMDALPFKKEEAENICDRVIIINKGKVIASGTPKEIKNQTKTSNLRDAFFNLIGGNSDDK